MRISSIYIISTPSTVGKRAMQNSARTQFRLNDDVHYFSSAQREQAARYEAIFARREADAKIARDIIPWHKPFQYVESELQDALLEIEFFGYLHRKLNAKLIQVRHRQENGGAAHEPDFPRGEIDFIRYMAAFGCVHNGSVSIGADQRKHVFRVSPKDLSSKGIDHQVYVCVVCPIDCRRFETFYYAIFDENWSDFDTLVDPKSHTTINVFEPPPPPQSRPQPIA